MWDYSESVKEHFLHPRNVGMIEEPDAVGEVGSLACGDALKLFLKLDENEVITDAKFQTFGCASAIASASALTEIIKGMPLDEAAKVTNQQVASYLEGLPEPKMHCSVMAREALEAAVHNYRTGETGPMIEKEGEVICHCFGVTDVEIRQVTRDNGLKTVEQITSYIKAGGGCGQCIDKIQAIVDEEVGGIHVEAPAVEQPSVRPLTNVQRILRIQNVLEEKVRPHLKLDGGDLELVDVAGNLVTIKLKGACATCPMSGGATREMIERMVREEVEPDLVIEVQSAR